VAQGWNRHAGAMDEGAGCGAGVDNGMQLCTDSMETHGMDKSMGHGVRVHTMWMRLQGVAWGCG